MPSRFKAALCALCSRSSIVGGMSHIVMAHSIMHCRVIPGWATAESDTELPHAKLLRFDLNVGSYLRALAVVCETPLLALQAVAGQQEAALSAGSQQAQIAHQHEVALAGPRSSVSRSL